MSAITTKKYMKSGSYSRGGNGIKYIVIHFVGAVSTAKNNLNYFYNNPGKGVGAHVFIDEDDIAQSVPFEKAIGHCGGQAFSQGRKGDGGSSFNGKCMNSNSIGIEMCVKRKNGKYYLEEGTVKNVAKAVKYLMAEYNIPKSRVIRHFDVTSKECPDCYVDDSLKGNLLTNKVWEKFKSTICGSGSTVKRKYTGLIPTETVNEHTGTPFRIKLWQAFLNWYGNYGLKVDGKFGTDTKKATIAFQKKEGLSADGSAGPATRKKALSFKK